MDIKEKLEQALKIDDAGRSVYVNLHVGDEILSIVAFDSKDKAESQRELMIDSLVQLLA